jgi:general secretion pathway protein F
MPLFRYRAVSSSGETVEGEMQAGSRALVIERLRDQGHLPLRADELHQRVRRGKVRPRDIALFTRQLSTLLQAGLTLDQALATLAGLDPASPRGRLAQRLQTSLRGGSSFSDALAAEGEAVFPSFHVGMVRAGEAGGALAQVLARLADFLMRREAMRQQVQSAMVYPAVLLAMAIGSVVILLTVVLPEFAPIIARSGEALPLPTRILLALGDGLERHGLLLAILLAALLLGLRRIGHNDAFCLARDRLVLALPVLGGLVRSVETARFSQVLAVLLRSGLPALPALQTATGTVANRAMRRALEGAAESLRQGRGLAEPLVASGALPRLAGQLIVVGEHSSRLEAMLEEVAQIHEAETETTLARLLALLVPGLTIFCGLLIAGVIAAILSAVMGVYEAAY